MVVTFSMYDDKDCYKILDKSGIINLDTPLNNLNNQTDSCRELLDFTIQYLFTEKDLGIITLLLSSIVLLLISFGLPFVIKGMEGFLSWTGPFRQFRSVGRFSWVFYYSIHLVLAISIYRFFKDKKSSILFWVPPSTVL